MSDGFAPLGWVTVALAGGFVLLAGVLSLALRLQLERSLAIGVVRATVQLTAIGYALTWIFDNVSLALTLLAMCVMTLMASRAALGRPAWTLDGGFIGVFSTLAVTAGVTAVIGSGLLIGVEPWYAPRYALPLLGMLLGNSLTGLSLCLDTLLEAVADQAEQIEMELALGASGTEAIRGPLRRAVQRGIVPIVNALMVAGIVSLPGMMTGQILAGAPPLEAVKYQLLILFLIAGTTSCACVGAAWFAALRLVDADARLRPDRVHARPREA